MNIKKLTINMLPLLLIGSAMVYAAAPSGGYLPNATLDPDCAPGDTDCFVQVVDDGDWTASGSDLFMTGGSVGIGTDTPAAYLHVDGEVNEKLRLEDTTGGYYSVSVNNGAQFSIQDDAGNTDFLIDNSGNVGIGSSAAPTAVLEVNGNIRLGDEGVNCNAANESEIRYNSATSKHQGCDGTTWNDLY